MGTKTNFWEAQCQKRTMEYYGMLEKSGLTVEEWESRFPDFNEELIAPQKSFDSSAVFLLNVLVIPGSMVDWRLQLECLMRRLNEKTELVTKIEIPDLESLVIDSCENPYFVHHVTDMPLSCEGKYNSFAELSETVCENLDRYLNLFEVIAFLMVQPSKFIATRHVFVGQDLGNDQFPVLVLKGDVLCLEIKSWDEVPSCAFYYTAESD